MNHVPSENITSSNIDLYKRKMLYFTAKAFIYGCLFSVLFKRPKTFFPLTLGLAAGYCNSDLLKIFYPDLQ